MNINGVVIVGGGGVTANYVNNAIASAIANAGGGVSESYVNNAIAIYVENAIANVSTGVSEGYVNNTVANAFSSMQNPLLLNISTVGSSNPDGSLNAPFSSIQAAHNYALTNVPVSSPVAIIVQPGQYNGNVTWTRPNLHIKGYFGYQNATVINGSINVNLETISGASLATNPISLEDLSLENTLSNSSIILLTGSQPINFTGHRIKMTTYTNNLNQSCIFANNTATEGLGFEVQDSNLESYHSNAVCVDISNLCENSNISRTSITSNYYVNIRFRSGYLELDDLVLDANGPNVIEIDGGTTPGGIPATFSMTQSGIYNNYPDSNGIIFTGPIQNVYVVENSFNTPTGNGYAMTSTASMDSVVLAHYGNMYPGNPKIKNTIYNFPITSTPSFVS
jgi:hypothetical protein